MQEKSPKTWRVWMLLILPPVIFLGVIIAASIYFGVVVGAAPKTIAERVAASTPLLLLFVQLFLLLLFWAIRRADRLVMPLLGWHVGVRQQVWQEVLIGVLPGLTLAIVYFMVLSPLLTKAQQVLGDYVPPGQLLPTLGSAALPFFLANVALAPFVEENIYRGYGVTQLSQHLGTLAASVVSCVCFGLLHWAGGFWYMVLTGVVAGGVFAGLCVWRKNIIAPYAAHSTLNLVEFIYVWLWIAH
jgi:uncharacterized protein